MASTSAYYYKHPQNVLDDIDYQFDLSNATLTRLVNVFLEEFQAGLSSYGREMAMIPSFVTGVPDGTETGTFLALDLGGTNLRVCEVVLKGDKTFTLRQQKYRVSDALKTGEATALFDYLADSVDSFLTANSPSDPTPSFSDNPFAAPKPDAIHLGFTFSFPVEQTALASGKILTWTKGFSAKNAVDHDVVKLLQDAFDRKHIHVKCVALVNDTVGALLSRAYTSGGCLLGSIFGTGTNGAYIEQVAKITKLGPNSPAIARGGDMVINTEWGAFDDKKNGLPDTPFDRTVDRESINQGQHMFEKLISGMYLGEIVRNVLLSLIDAAPKALLFGGKSTKSLNEQWGLDTSVMSDVETAWEGEKAHMDKIPVPVYDQGEAYNEDLAERLEKVRGVIVKELGFEKKYVSLRDAYIVRWICSLVATRAGLLSGVPVAAVLIQTNRATLAGSDGKSAEPAMKEDKINVGVDGSLIEHYPHFEHTLRRSLRLLVGEEIEKKVVIGLAKDGSGVGAALCALQASKDLS